MPKTSKKILVVDDDPNVRTTVGMLLGAEGYEIATAENGFDALLHMKSVVPDLVISDLNMPQMSGFEFLSVIRRRFPEVVVVAMSGAYEVGEGVPGGVIADAFHAKGGPHPRALVKMVSELLRTSGAKASAHTRKSAPVWVPRNGSDAKGVPYIVLTCTECLRSFPLNVPTEPTGTVVETACIFCLNTVQYIIDFSFTVASPKKEDAGSTATRGRAAG